MQFSSQSSGIPVERQVITKQISSMMSFGKGKHWEPKGKVHATGRFHSQQPFLLLEDLWLPMCAFLWIFQNKFSILFFSPRIYFKPIFTEIWPMPNLTPPKGGAEKKMLIGSHCFTAKNVIKKKKNFQGASTLLIRIPHRCQRSLWL